MIGSLDGSSFCFEKYSVIRCVISRKGSKNLAVGTNNPQTYVSNVIAWRSCVIMNVGMS